jgi:D-proline reductase (dithiol) PrdB
VERARLLFKSDNARMGHGIRQEQQDMTAPPDDPLGFAPDDDVPIPYMARTREYYQAIGYTTPYRWAHYVDAPFQPLNKPLARSRLAIVTTAAPFDPAKGDQGPGAKYNGGAKFYAVYDGDSFKTHDLRISHIAYDRVHTTADDSGSWFPLPQLHRLAGDGRILEVAPRFFGAPTNRSQRVTLETDAPAILASCRADQVDAVVLVPNCPVCHQTVSLVARHLEAGGIATVVMGCAKDIVEHAAVPRFLFSDFPLGNSAGRPHDPASQAFTLELALRVLETAPAARTTVQSPLRWSAEASWKRDYNNVAQLSDQELARRRREFDAQKQIARTLRETAT